MTGRQGALSIPKAPRGVQLYLFCYCASQLQIRNAETAPSDPPRHGMRRRQQRLMWLACLAAAAANHINHFLLFFLRWLALGARVVLVLARLDAGDVHFWARQASDRNKFPKRSSQKLVRPFVPLR